MDGTSTRWVRAAAGDARMSSKMGATVEGGGKGGLESRDCNGKAPYSSSKREHLDD